MQNARHVLGGLTLGEESIPEFFATRYPRQNPRKPIRLVPLFFLFGLILPAVSTSSVADGSIFIPKPHLITVTAYTNVTRCTDSTPNITASLLHIKPQHYWKVIALSRDLAKHYRFGDKFQLYINGEPHLVEFQDLMPGKHKRKIDLLLPSIKKCKDFGKKKGILIPLSYEREEEKCLAG